MKVHLVHRLVGGAALMLVGWQAGSEMGGPSSQPRNAAIGIISGCAAGLLLSPWLVSKPYDALRRLIGRMPPGELMAAISGLILGLVVAALLSFPLSFLPWSIGHVLPAIAAVVCGYLGITIMMMRQRELATLIQNQRGEERVEAQPGGGDRFLVDTSAIIDGRIADIGQSGFLAGSLLVPRFVLRELQHIADSSDPLRRNRGRRGLEILNRLQKDPITPVTICDLDAREIPDVDSKLVKLARDTNCPVVTNDFNLNRIAELQGVRVLNVNQLANALKPVVLPGEEMAVHIIQEGKENNQGVAYLDDGTMIVVENGLRFIHSDIEVVVTRVLQTVAGRMIFAHPKSVGKSNGRA